MDAVRGNERQILMDRGITLEGDRNEAQDC